MGRQAVKLNKKAEAAEIAELSERVLSEAPARGANPLLTESDEVAEAGKVVYGKQKRFSELPLSKRTLAGLREGKFERLTAAAISATIFFYVAINLLMVMGMAPVTGIPLPLVSHGGSSMMTVMFAIGILFAIDRQSRNSARAARW